MYLPKVSIIIPVHNAEAHIKECVRNLIAQTYKNIEIICVDDGSDDKSFEVLKSLACEDNRIKIISQENQGVSVARNKGLKLADSNSEWVMFCDGHDYFEWNAVEQCIKEALSHQGCDVVLFNARMFSPDGTFQMAISGSQYVNMPHYIDCTNSEYLGCFANVCFGMFSFNTIRNNNISFRNGYIYEDWEFAGHFLSKADSAIWLDAMLYNYRWNQPNSISTIVNKSCLDIFETLELVEIHYKAASRWNNVQYSHYVRALGQLIFFQKNRLPKANEDVRNKFQEKMQTYIQTIPYILLCSVANYLSMEQRIDLLMFHSDADLEVKFCRQNWNRLKLHRLKQRIHEKVKQVMMKIMPAYRVANHTRCEMEAMHHSEMAKLDILLGQQNQIIHDIRLMKQILGIDMQNAIIKDIEAMTIENHVTKDGEK